MTSDPRKWSYCVRYGQLRAPRRGTYRFELACTILDGEIAVGVLSAGGRFWIPSDVHFHRDATSRRFEITVDLHQNQEFSLVVSNSCGDGVSRFIIRGLCGSVDPAQTVAGPSNDGKRLPFLWRGAASYARDRWARVARPRHLRERLSAAADVIAGKIAQILGERLRYRVVRSAPEFQSLQQAVRASDERLRELAPLLYLADFNKLLRDRRPDNLHVNGCGDFQLMAREHWHDLRAYPEFETFSMNIDGLFSYIADAAGVKEELLPMPIYHLEHEIGSGWSPEGETLLRRRIAERGITWLDATTVHIWASYMRWLGRPMIFNGPDWGMAKVELLDRSTMAACRITS